MAEKKKTATNTFTEKSVKELVGIRTKLRQELHGLKMKHAIKGLKETHHITKAKKDIARVNTVLTSKIKENYGDNMK